MVSASQINDLIRSYLSGSLNLQRFADAFEAIYSDINVAGEHNVLSLGDHVQVLLSRVSSGYANENDLRGWFLALSQTSNSGSSVQIQSSSAETYSDDPGHLITVPA